jgi:uncharacterized YigZ family protein
MYSISKNATNTIIINKSKFITFIYKVNNIDEVKAILDNLKNNYNDASHICFAYILDGNIKASDDGEPSGTAGTPILNVLTKNKLNRVLCVVIRYFGGIKLGAGGLVRAYSNSVIEVLKLTNITEVIEGYLVELIFSYDNLKVIDYMLTNKNIIKKEYNDNITYQFYLSNQELDFISQLEKLAISINIKGKVLMDSH